MKIWNKYFDLPPVWLTLFLLIGWLQARAWNPLTYQSETSTLIGGGLILGGFALMIVSFLYFVRHKTSVVPKRTPKSIITTGPYKYSRNPIYLADVIILFGAIVALGSMVSLILIPIFMWVIRTRFINGEEGHIRAEFGQPYSDYCAQTRRWI